MAILKTKKSLRPGKKKGQRKMQITLTMDLTDANIKKLAAFLNEVSEDPKTTEAPKASTNKKKAEPKTEAPEAPKAEPKTEAPEAVKTEAPVPVPEVEAQKITKTDLRAVALKLSKSGKADELEKIFGEFGAANLSSIKETDYPALMERLVAINA